MTVELMLQIQRIDHVDAMKKQEPWKGIINLKRALFLSLCVLVLFGLVGCREKKLPTNRQLMMREEYMKLYLNDIEIPIIWAKFLI